MLSHPSCMLTHLFQVNFLVLINHYCCMSTSYVFFKISKNYQHLRGLLINWGGAYRYDGKSFTSFKFPNNGFTRIIEDKKGNLWFGGDGIHRYDGKNFTHFSTKDGLINTSVWSILEDKTGNFWVGTRETGLYLYDGKTFITYSEYKHLTATNQSTIFGTPGKLRKSHETLTRYYQKRGSQHCCTDEYD